MADEDDRFSHIKNDPRFRSIPKWERKVKIDNRFAAMFHDKRFKLQYEMDKRGRSLQRSTTEDLKKYYEVDSDESEKEEIETNVKKATASAGTRKLVSGKKINKKLVSKAKKEKNAENKNRTVKMMRHHEESDSGNESTSDGQVLGHIRLKTLEETSEDEENENNSEQAISSASEEGDKEEEEEEEESQVDLARGEGNVETSSSDESSDDEEEESGFDHQWGEMQKGVPRSDDVFRRLAVCNLDWDRIKASDLYVLFHNFKPAQGHINSVTIYPSEFGIQRMREEEIKGPAELTQTTLEKDEDDFTESREGSKYHMETLRKYQLNRLRYYFAVVDCDSAETAANLYNELDGMEYESSASQLDLRFIPDDEVFTQTPKSVADKLPDMSTFEPVLFTTKALQQTMVELTWDENNPDRVKTLEKAFWDNTDDLNTDLRAYLASSSSEDETQDNSEDNVDNEEVPASNESRVSSKIAKYKQLLASIEEEDKKKKDRDIEMEITWEPGLKDRAESLIKMKQQKQEMTCFEQYLEKKKENKKQRLKEKKKEQVEEENQDLCDDNNDDIPSDVDLNDPFFQDELKNIKGQKPTKKTRRKQKEEPQGDSKSNAELELLLMEDGEDQKKHFNLKHLVEEAAESKRKKKRNLKKRALITKPTDDFEINTEDTRFSALFSSADYNIDPSDTHFKKTKAMEALLQEKQKRRAEVRPQVPSEVPTESVKRKMDPSLSFLVKSVKNKTENFKRRKH